MKHVTIIVPNGRTNLSSLVGCFDILTSAHKYWKRMGNRPMMEIHIAGYMTELKLDTDLFSIHPENIREIERTDC